MKKFSKSILAGILSLSLLVGCGTSAPANADAHAGHTEAHEHGTASAELEKTKFNFGSLTGTATALAYVAKEEGFFAEEGLDVTMNDFASASQLLSGLESGNLDAVFIGSVPTITSQAAGHDVTIFGGAMTNGHGYVIKTNLLPEGFKEGDIEVLRGKNIASVKNSIQDYELLVLLKKYNIEIGEGENQANVIYFESQKDAFNALAGEEIDAVSVYPPYASLAVNSGHTVVYYCTDVEEFKDQPCCRQVALTDSLEKYPDTYKAFERALIKAYKFTQENTVETVEDVAVYAPIDKTQIEFELYGGHVHSVPDPDKTATVHLKNEVVDFGYTDGVDYDINTLYNTDIYKAALDSIIAEYPDDEVYKGLAERFETANLKYGDCCA
ncbi:MAG: ABC transporter substrate-binding protein [Ruminococcus sp.]|jgi:NitT/TauT family transport system substrate-binding protein|nr:ABC transporter substrate-binding protein [Ruminococcus sp.]